MSLVATLIANPNNPVLAGSEPDRAAAAVGATAIEWLAPAIACDIAISPSMNRAAAQSALRTALGPLAADIVIQPVAGRRKRLLVADMDSTMIDQECIDELADEAGVRDRVEHITARAMNGEIEFEAALRERVALLRGLPLSVIDRVLADRITLAAGGPSLIATMRANGASCLLVSGGFTQFAGRIADMLGFDDFQANELLAAGGRLSGTVREPILGRDAKRDALLRLASGRGLSPQDAMAVGDGANDLAMLEAAGSGVALHAKASVAARARLRIDHGDLTALLYIQGYRQSEFRSDIVR